MTFKENVFFILCFIHLIDSGPIEPEVQVTTEQTRRILKGVEVHDTRPYMVYLRPAQSSDTNQPPDPNWLCGGVIIHERYILTSAACIEDVRQFFVVSGTNKWLPMPQENDCIKYGAKKAVWKCVPKNYIYDGEEFDNIRWMSGDLAVVKVEDNFNFEKRIKGCDFIPQKIAYNNVSADLEKGGLITSTAGWGSVDSFSKLQTRARTSSGNSPNLMETEVVILSNKNCKKRWDPRYHTIIDESMICVKDDHDVEDAACAQEEADCKELIYSDQEDSGDAPTRRFMINPETLEVHSASHYNSNQSLRRYKVSSGGFCENDHGGPLVHGQGKSAVVIGVISACLTRKVTKKCYGPFLYTSVFKYRNVISCAINKDVTGENACKLLLRTSKTHLKETNFNWDGYTKGSAKRKLPNVRSLKNTERAQMGHNFKFKNDKSSDISPVHHILQPRNEHMSVTPKYEYNYWLSGLRLV